MYLQKGSRSTASQFHGVNYQKTKWRGADWSADTETQNSLKVCLETEPTGLHKACEEKHDKC